MTTKVRIALAMKQEYHSCMAGMVKAQYEAGTFELQACLLAVSNGKSSTVQMARVMPRTTTALGNHACSSAYGRLVESALLWAAIGVRAPLSGKPALSSVT